MMNCNALSLKKESIWISCFHDFKLYFDTSYRAELQSDCLVVSSNSLSGNKRGVHTLTEHE